MDELAASLGVRYPSPARARPQFANNYQASTPLARRSPNVRRKQLDLDVTPSLLRGVSPAKSMFFDPDPEHGGEESPWRIKVTVQAEPRNGSSPTKSPAPRTRVMRIPLKDADGSSPAKPKAGRKRKSDADSVIKKRKGTPMRRRSGRISGGERKSLEDEQEWTPAPQEQPAKKRRGRPRKSALAEPEPAIPKPEIPVAEIENDLVQTAVEDNVLDEDGEDDLPQGINQDDDDDIHDVIQVNSGLEVEDADVDPAVLEDEEEQPDYQLSQNKAEPAPVTAKPPRPTSTFDFSKLTPLHVRHALPRPKEHTPQYRDPRGPYVATELYNEQFLPKQIQFSPLPPRRSPAKSPAPFSKRQSSPATEEDADMWRSMIGRKSMRGGDERSSADMESDLGSDIEPPDATFRTIGEATMMQSEDFSIVSLSSLPSAKDINSSLLGQSEGHSQIEPRQPSKLHKAVTFSSPLAQSFHSHTENSPQREIYENGLDDEALALDPTPQKRSASTRAENSFLPDYTRQVSRDSLRTPEKVTASTQQANRQDFRVSHPHNPDRQQQTPNATTPEARLPTPSSGEHSDSPSLPIEQMQSDISYPEIDEEPIDPRVQDTPAKSEAEMSTPPVTPEPDEHPQTKRVREASLLSSGSKRSWVEEPKSARIIALENRWQEDRKQVLRTLEQAKASAVTIESDAESDDQDEELHRDPIPVQDPTEDVWQDISASYEAEPTRRTHKRPMPAQRPSKVARTERVQSPGAAVQSHVEEEAATPRKTFTAENNMASVQRRAKTKSDVAALFGGLRGNGDAALPTFKVHRDVSPAKPSPLRNNVFVDGTLDHTDVDLSDVRQIREEMRMASKRPPFPVGRGSTTVTKIPTKIKSVDDTVTTVGEEETVDDVDAAEQSVISFTGQRQPSRSLFTGSKPREASVKVETVRPTNNRRTSSDHNTSSASEGLFSTIWRTLTFTHEYVPPARPTHAILADSNKYPLLPSTWAWSHTHWQTLDSLYQYYKRKPSRFNPARRERPNNDGLLTAAWERYINIEFSHWGYRVRLESTHIILAILFHSLLLLPSEADFLRVNGKQIDWGCQDRTRRKGQKITEWDCVVHLFAVIAGEMVREDEGLGRKVRREEEAEFMFRLGGEAVWKLVSDVPPS